MVRNSPHERPTSILVHACEPQWSKVAYQWNRKTIQRGHVVTRQRPGGIADSIPTTSSSSLQTGSKSRTRSYYSIHTLWFILLMESFDYSSSDTTYHSANSLIFALFGPILDSYNLQGNVTTFCEPKEVPWRNHTCRTISKWRKGIGSMGSITSGLKLQGALTYDSSYECSRDCA